MVAALTQRVTELKRRLACDSSNFSRPPSSDAPWSKKPAKKRSSRSRSGRKPGKQPGASSSSRNLLDDADETLEIQPQRCQRCDASLEGAQECRRQRRQVVDVRPGLAGRAGSSVCNRPFCAASTPPDYSPRTAPRAGNAARDAPNSPSLLQVRELLNQNTPLAAAIRQPRTPTRRSPPTHRPPRTNHQPTPPRPSNPHRTAPGRTYRHRANQPTAIAAPLVTNPAPPSTPPLAPGRPLASPSIPGFQPQMNLFARVNPKAKPWKQTDAPPGSSPGHDGHA